MPSLSELQRRFAAIMLDPAREPGERIAVYRHTMLANYRKALGAAYPVVRELTGMPFFHAAVDAFVVAHPATDGDLNVYGATFPAFLATYAHAAQLPYLPDVARLEWTMDEANRAADSQADAQRTLATLAATPADEVALQCFVLDPSCRLLRSAFPVLRIWQAHRDGSVHSGDVEFSTGDDFLLVRRERDSVVIERVGAADFAFLGALAAGVDLAQALDAAFDADATFELGTALRTYIGNGVLSTVVTGD